MINKTEERIEMTKSHLLAKTDEILKANSAILNEMTDPWELAHQNATTVLELKRLINKYCSQPTKVRQVNRPLKRGGR